MNENAKRKAHTKEVIDSIKAKYDTSDVTEKKKEVMKSWIKSVEKRESSLPSQNTAKDKALVLKMYKQIEEREKKKAAK
jgi:hypothetical protein